MEFFQGTQRRIRNSRSKRAIIVQATEGLLYNPLYIKSEHNLVRREVLKKTSGFGFSTSPSGPGESKVHAIKPMSDPYIIIVFFTIYVFDFADKSSGDFNIYINRFQRAALTIKRTYREVDGGKMFHPLVTGTVKLNHFSGVYRSENYIGSRACIAK